LDYHTIESHNRLNLKENQHKNYESYNHRNNDYNDDVVSVGTWIIILIVVAIPIINIIVLLILAFGDHNENLKNFAKASLILIVVGFFLAVLLSACTY
jgi:hypothetical protein